MATNPILTELQGLSPGAQQALMQAHTAAAPKIAKPMDAGPAPNLAGPAMTGPAPSLQAPPSPNVVSAPPPKMALGTEGGDQQERQRLLNTGSGIHQINNPVLRGLAGVGNAVGSIAAPGLMREIPGTEEHHDQLLGRVNKNLTGDLAIGQKQATEAETNARVPNLNANTAHTEAETPTIAPLAQSRENLEGAQTNEANAHTAAIPEEEADKHSLVQPTIGHLNAESNSLANPKKTPIEQTYDDLLKQGMTPIQAYEKVREKPGGTTINQGTWTLDEDPTTGKPVEFNSKTGETKAAPAGVAKSGTFAKAQAATAPAKQAIEYADSYKSGIHTGPGDEALMEKFFELAKPSTGFRMSQPQIDMLKNAQSWASSLESHLRHATTGTWFSDDQRNQIVGTMHDLAKAKGLEEGGSPSSSSGLSVSLADARNLPQNKGKSDADITADIKAHGHEVRP